MSAFKTDILQGLSQNPKKLPSRYFYDTEGDLLFQEIMQLDEYYLPGCETEILNSEAAHIARAMDSGEKDLEIVELGAGDGSKITPLLKAIRDSGQHVLYRPLDISSHILEKNAEHVKQTLPDIEIQPGAGNYFKIYPGLSRLRKRRLILFLGSNIGNFNQTEARDFFKFLHKGMQAGDRLMVAFDLVKDPRKVLAAYDDSCGVTAAFNLNLLERINRELGADFDTSQFQHFPTYDPTTGMTRSYLISMKEQVIHFPGGPDIPLRPFEPIHTEVSKKYRDSEIDDLILESGFEVVNKYYDPGQNYSLVLMGLSESFEL